MANSKSSSNMRNLMYSGKHPLLPPKSPFPSVSPSYADYVFTPAIGSKAIQKPRDGNAHHQRTSSESLLIEEQPSWLDDLLNEPDTPIRRGGHRRSSSDSFAYVDAINVSNIDYAAQDDYKYNNNNNNMYSSTSWGAQDFDPQTDLRHASLYTELNLVKQKNKSWESSVSAASNPRSLPSVKDNFPLYSSGPQEGNGVASTASEKQDQIESGPHDPKASSEKKDNSNAKPYASETDAKRAKQQFAQRSRVRKLQYIAELERNVQALQAEGTEVTAELEFLNQQNLILSMENKALKQRLENIAQEQLIKYLEQELLEREIGRLRALYQQQQQQHQQQQQQQQQLQQQRPSSSHRRNNSRDLDSQFANLSLKHKEANAGRDPVTGALRI